MGFPNVLRVEADGRKGGIWLCWDAQAFRVEVLSACFQHLTFKVSSASAQPWILTAVYASPRHNLQRFLWNSIFGSSEEIELPWLLTGDFNTIKDPSEQAGPATPDIYRRCKRFSDRISQAKLIDLGFSGPRFTWTRGDTPSSDKASCIDRSLCNAAWNAVFPDSTVNHLPQLHSDHHPLLTRLVVLIGVSLRLLETREFTPLLFLVLLSLRVLGLLTSLIILSCLIVGTLRSLCRKLSKIWPAS
ncbi:unnamed protein product [Linum trigynum]|uniref:Endonuclease/exonuclease/phosphatase domain-containing protein n=1 Tax=Linum trigynum TaxID=586398 RepID=A0AAV2CAZ6_9ROSI